MSGIGNRNLTGLRWLLGTRGFVGFPTSISAPRGWVKVEGEILEEPADFAIIHPSQLYEITQTSTTYAQTYVGDYYTPIDLKYFNKVLFQQKTQSNEYITTRVKLDQSLYYGNQFAYYKKTVFSWWHSPYGDLPLDPPVWLNGGTLPFYFMQPQACRRGDSIQPDIEEDDLYLGYKITTNDDHPTTNTIGFILPTLYRHGKVAHFFGSLTAVIAGVFPIAESDVLVVVVTNFTKPDLFRIKLKSNISHNEVILISTNFYESPEPFEMLHPWRWSANGLELSTLVGRRVTHPDTTFTIFPTLVTVTLDETLQEDGHPSFAIQDIQTTDYLLSLNDYATTTVDTSGLTSSYEHTGYRVYEGDTQYPIALSYQGNSLILARKDYTDFQDNVSISGTRVTSGIEGNPNNPGSGETSMSGTVNPTIRLTFGASSYLLNNSIVSGSYSGTASAATTGTWPFSGTGTYTESGSQSISASYYQTPVYLDICNNVVVFYENQALSTNDDLSFSGDSSSYGVGTGERTENKQITFGYTLRLNQDNIISSISTSTYSETLTLSTEEPPYFYTPESPQDMANYFMPLFGMNDGTVSFIPRYTQGSFRISLATDFRVKDEEVVQQHYPYFGEFTAPAFTFYPPFNETPAEFEAIYHRLTNLTHFDDKLNATATEERTVEYCSPIGLI